MLSLSIPTPVALFLRASALRPLNHTIKLFRKWGDRFKQSFWELKSWLALKRLIFQASTLRRPSKWPRRRWPRSARANLGTQLSQLESRRLLGNTIIHLTKGNGFRTIVWHERYPLPFFGFRDAEARSI